LIKNKQGKGTVDYDHLYYTYDYTKRNLSFPKENLFFTRVYPASH